MNERVQESASFSPGNTERALGKWHTHSDIIIQVSRSNLLPPTNRKKKHTEKEYGSSKTVQIDVLRDRFKRNLTCIPLPLIPFFSTQAETCQVTSDWLVAHRAGRLPTQKSQPRAEACPWFWRKDKKKEAFRWKWWIEGDVLATKEGASEEMNSIVRTF